VISVIRKIDDFSLHTAGRRGRPQVGRRGGIAGTDGSTVERDFAVDSLQMQQKAIRRFNS